MEAFKQILAVTNRNEDPSAILDKIAALEAAGEAKIQVIRVIHENLVEYGKMSAEDAQALKVFIMQAEEEQLTEQLEAHLGRFANLESATIWNKRVSSGVVDVAKDLGADLVVKSTDSGPQGIARHPDDWNLIRETPCPVWLVGNQPLSKTPVVTTALDALDVEHEDVNLRILDTGAAFADQLSGKLEVISAYPALKPWASSGYAGLDLVRMQHELAEEVEVRCRYLLEKLEIQADSIQTGEGNPEQAIIELTDASGSDVVVLGTAARHGVSAWVIGNTSELLLGHLERDLLVLHI